MQINKRAVQVVLTAQRAAGAPKKLAQLVPVESPW
jgi:hypothetical protein